jgi:hypothetical protein
VTPPLLVGSHVLLGPSKTPDRKGLQPKFGLALDYLVATFGKFQVNQFVTFILVLKKG